MNVAEAHATIIQDNQSETMQQGMLKILNEEWQKMKL